MSPERAQREWRMWLGISRVRGERVGKIGFVFL